MFISPLPLTETHIHNCTPALLADLPRLSTVSCIYFLFFQSYWVHVACVTHKSDPQGKRVFVLHANWMDWEKSTTCHSFEKVKSLRCFDSVM